MSGLDNLKTRLDFIGGKVQQGRMNKGKLESLKRALLYSYQAETAKLLDGREFRCLINPDKLKNDYDDKIISIPFEDICLNTQRKGKTSQGIEKIGMKAGDVFEWKENNTYWIVYLQRLEETAYFRAEIRRCRYEIEINNNKYKVYTRGPIEQSIKWNTKENDIVNSLNYTLMMTITNNEETDAFFHRFSIIKFKGKNWEVQAVDSISTEGIIDIYLKEYYSNSIADKLEEEKAEMDIPEIEIDENEPIIEGDKEVYPYDIKEFIIKNATDGEWFIDNNKVKIITQSASKAKVQINTGKSGKFELSYRVGGDVVAAIQVTILSL